MDWEKDKLGLWKRWVRDSLNGSEWKKEVEAMSSLGWYRAVLFKFGAERYIASWEVHEAIRLRFRLRTGSAGLLEDKRRCGMCVV